MGLSTVPEHLPLSRARRGRTARRVFVVLLCLFVALGVLGVFGVRTTTVRASGGGYEVELRYARTARPGLSVPWSVTIRRPEGFDGPVTLASTSAYFDIFDENSFDPEPESTTTDGERTIWEFQPPQEGDTMEISLDTRIGPNVQWGRRGRTAVLVGGQPVAEVEYRTVVLP